MELSLHPRRNPASRLTACSVIFAGLACLLAARPATADQIPTSLASFPGGATSGTNPVAGVTLDAAGNLFGTTPSVGASSDGTVFEIARGSNAITTLASFNGTNGANPVGDVTFDAAGNLYGATQFGGANGLGTVFEIAKGSSVITTLASFTGTNAIGANPFGGVALDAAGDIFGTTLNGGANGLGTVFEIAKGSNTITTLASFFGGNGANPAGDVTLDANGNLFGTTPNGGANGDGTVFEVLRGSRAITTLASFPSGNGANPLSGVTLDAAGNLFGVGGGVGTVFEIAKGSNAITTLASFGGANGSEPSGRLALDALGNLYGTAFDGGPKHLGSIFELSQGSNAITTLATFTGANGMGPLGGVALDAAGNFYGTTQYGGAYNTENALNGNGTVFELTTAAVPEPASVLLLGIGISVLAGHAGWRRHAARSGADR